MSKTPLSEKALIDLLKLSKGKPLNIPASELTAQININPNHFDITKHKIK